MKMQTNNSSILESIYDTIFKNDNYVPFDFVNDFELSELNTGHGCIYLKSADNKSYKVVVYEND